MFGAIFRVLNRVKLARTRQVKSFFLQWRFFLKNRLYNNSVKINDTSLVVSLTTYHERLPYVYLTLESVLAQRVDVDYAVKLYLSDEDILKVGRLPKELLRLKRRGVQIISKEENLRSYKKLVYETESNVPVVIADDDVFYPKDWLQSLVDVARKFDWRCVVAHRGHPLILYSSTIASYREILSSSHINSRRLEPSYSFMPTGVGGVLYPAGCLNEKFSASQLFSVLAPDADDIWFKVCSLEAGYKAVQTRRKNINYLSVLPVQKTGLFRADSSDQKNDFALSRTFQAFPHAFDLIKKEQKSQWQSA